MRLLALIAVAALAACGQPQGQDAASTPQTSAAAVSPAEAPAPVGQPLVLTMGGDGLSETGEPIPAELTLTQTAVQFQDGASAQTAFLGLADRMAPIAQGGPTFATAAASEQTNLRVELRRITGQAPPQLCGGAATHVVIATTDPLTVLKLIAFSGPDAPGPNARNSAVCGTMDYYVS